MNAGTTRRVGSLDPDRLRLNHRGLRRYSSSCRNDHGGGSFRSRKHGPYKRCRIGGARRLSTFMTARCDMAPVPFIYHYKYSSSGNASRLPYTHPPKEFEDNGTIRLSPPFHRVAVNGVLGWKTARRIVRREKTNRIFRDNEDQSPRTVFIYVHRVDCSWSSR